MESSGAISPQKDAGIETHLARLEAFVKELIHKGRFELNFTIRPEPAEDAAAGPIYVVNFSGPDAYLLLESNAALLDALEYLAHKAMRLDEALHHRVSFDCDGYRRVRIEELKTTATLAAERVVERSEPFSLNPMNARERRVIHLTLRDHTQVKTESRGFGAERHVVILPAVSTAPRK